MNLREYIQSEIKLQLDESVNWAEFYKMAKDTSGYNPSFEKKYGSLLDRPHVKDALKNTKDFKSFMKHINKFESVNEAKKPYTIVVMDDGKRLAVDNKDISRLKSGKDVVGKSLKYAGQEEWVHPQLVKKIEESVNEGIWPKSKLADRFEFILSDELKKNFKGIFYVVGYDLYHNDKKVMTINPDKDSVDSIIKSLKSKLKESVNEEFIPKVGTIGDFELKNLLMKNPKVNTILGNNEKSFMKKSDVVAIMHQSKRFNTIFTDGKQEFEIDMKSNKLVKPLTKARKEIVAHFSKKESVNEEEEQLDEKLITFSNRAPYGQVVFMAGGAGSGKGFAINNFIDSAGFKVRDVDEMKKAVGELDKLGKFSIDAWFKKYADKLSEEERAHVEEFVVGKGMTISDVASNLKNPNNVAALHYIVDAMGLKDKWLINMLAGKTNKETLPNLLFDITAKKVNSITEVIKPLIDVGYDPKNIHLIWVLTNYHLAVQQNKDRARVVPDDILLNTHEGAAKTIWSILTQGLPKGLDGRIDVILNNRENTVTYKDSKGNKMKGAVAGFLSLPVKKQGGGILPEKVWKETLYKWVVDNGPKTVDLRKPLDLQMKK